MNAEYKVGDKVIWTGRAGWGRPAPWVVKTVLKVTSAGRVRVGDNGPLYNRNGWPVGDTWRTAGQIEPWSEEREAELRADDARYAAAAEFRGICKALADIRDEDLAARLLPLVPKEFRAAIAKAEGEP